MFIIKPVSVQVVSGRSRQAYQLIEIATALCFGIFSTEQRAQNAMVKLLARHRRTLVCKS